MSAVILYRDPERPHDGDMTMIMDQERTEATIKELEKRGFVVEKITFVPHAKSARADEIGFCQRRRRQQ